MQHLWMENRSVFVKQSDLPQPKIGTALIQTRLAGICGTDLQLMNGYYGFCGIPGHEFVGEVIEAPNHPRWHGKRVVADINMGCGQCEFCQAGDPHHCIQRTALGISASNGAFSEYMILPLENLYEVPAEVSDEKAVFCEPIAAAAHVLDAARFASGDKVLLIGAGKLGLLIAQVIASVGCQLDVVVRHQRQGQLLEEWGIQHLSAQEIKAGAYSIVIEASGSSDGFSLALGGVRANGTIVLKSTYKGELTMDTSQIVKDEIKIIGSRCGSITQALSLLQLGKVDPLPLIEARYSLDQAIQAFERASQKGALKVLFEF